MAQTIQEALASIPTAADDQIIDASYHNSLREAVRLLAERPSGGGTTAGTTFTFAPALSPNGNAPAWAASPGLATQPGDGAQGWLQLQLPDGARIQQVVVHGRRGPGAMDSLIVQLIRQSINPSDPPTRLDQIVLAVVSLRDAPTRFAVAQLARDADASAADNEQHLRVDNANFKYLLTAILRGATVDAQVELRAFQVICGRS
jgi:hypothetical protein